MSRVVLCFVLLSLALPLFAQGVDPSMYQELHWRMIGPHRAGRTVGAVGIPDQPNVFYIGVNNGGVWKTDDYGRTWTPIFDDQPTGSIGAIALAPSDPNIIYVGSGEGLQRPDLSTGDGVFKSTDGGKSWKFMGLGDVQQIGAVIVDPRNPNKVFVAALGHPYGPNEQRGVFRSNDGGATWQKVLYKDPNTCAVALEFDPRNPDIIYADMWASRQGPWENGGWEGKTSGLYKSTDGGDNWHQLTDGLPTNEHGFGRIGIGIAPADPSRIYVLVDDGDLAGLYRSDDAGAHWKRMNTDERIWGRGSDFAEVKVDPKNSDLIYVANTCTYKSTDGGSTFVAFKGAPGGDDYHTIWINPKHSEIMLIASDQGATITVNGGKTWSSWYNQPTAQLYHVIADNEFPYNLYGGQQESGSVGIASRGQDGEITFRDWHPVSADEWAYVAPDPLHPNLIYGGKCTRYDKISGQVQNVAPEAMRSGKYRFLRTSPLAFSPVDLHALYLAANVLFKTVDGGEHWEIISPDLSREKAEVPGPDTLFKTPERRGVIYALGLSPLNKDLIWAGTDDGLVHRTTDGGKNWKNVTSSAITSWSKIAGMDAGHFDQQTAYIAVNRIKLDDLRPHIYRTHDGGTTWTEIVGGLPESGPVNAVREDPVQKGLLFAATERAVYVSFDDGSHWQSLRLNMPATSIRDLIIHNSDIAIGTHGRSFWILDNITPLRQLAANARASMVRLFAPDTAWRVRWNQNDDTPLPPEEPGGENPSDGTALDYLLPSGVKEVALEVTDADGKPVWRMASDTPPEFVDTNKISIPTYWIRPHRPLSTAPGMHRFIWNLHYSSPDSIPRTIPMAAIYKNTPSMPRGPWVLPGRYTVTLIADGKRLSQPLTVRMDPRVPASSADLAQQHDLSMVCYNGLTSLLKMNTATGGLRRQIAETKALVKDAALRDSLDAVDKKLQSVRGEGVAHDIDITYFTAEDGSSVKETIGGLRTKLTYMLLLIDNVDARPTPAQTEAIRRQQALMGSMTDWWTKFQSGDLVRINAALAKAALPVLH